MRRRLVFLLAWLGPAIALVHAAPARPLYEPPTPPQPQSFDLRGTTWTGYCSAVGADWIAHFESDGTLRYSYKGATYVNGTWKVEGNSLYFETNKRYSEFRGEIRANSISGECWNTEGDRWRIELRRCQ
jgi:hypothetical protein